MGFLVLLFLAFIIWVVTLFLPEDKNKQQPPARTNVHQAMFMMGMMDDLSGDPEGEDMMYYAAMNEEMENQPDDPDGDDYYRGDDE